MCKSGILTIEEMGDIVKAADFNAEIIAISEFVRKRVCRRGASGMMPGQGDPQAS